jgi:hypothetical protein
MLGVGVPDAAIIFAGATRVEFGLELIDRARI